MEIQLHTGQTVKTDGIVTDATTGKELGYLVNLTPGAILPKFWICEKEKVKHFRPLPFITHPFVRLFKATHTEDKANKKKNNREYFDDGIHTAKI